MHRRIAGPATPSLLALCCQAVVVLLLAGCAAVPAEDDATMSRLPEGRPLDEIISRVREDAARRTGVEPAAVRVLTAKTVTWPDGALGCPEPGMAYTQALVPGYRVIVSSQGQTLDYHASRTGRLVLCPPERSTEPLGEDPTT